MEGRSHTANSWRSRTFVSSCSIDGSPIGRSMLRWGRGSSREAGQSGSCSPVAVARRRWKTGPTELSKVGGTAHESLLVALDRACARGFEAGFFGFNRFDLLSEPVLSAGLFRFNASGRWSLGLRPPLPAFPIEAPPTCRIRAIVFETSSALASFARVADIQADIVRAGLGEPLGAGAAEAADRARERRGRCRSAEGWGTNATLA